MLDRIMRALEQCDDIQRLEWYFDIFGVKANNVSTGIAPSYWVLEGGKYYVYSAQNYDIEGENIIKVNNYFIEVAKKD